MKILTAPQMRNIDRRATDRFGVPSIVLMENAATAVVDTLFAHYPDVERAAIFCGPGANGGDGFAVARHLENRGVVPMIFLIGDRKRIQGDALTNLSICERLGLPIYDADSIEHAAGADVIVDAIFGTGLDRAPEGVFAETILAIAELRLPIVAVDVPSGLDASSDQPLEPCIHAEVTVTFAAPKVCHIFEPAAMLCGEIVVADIGIPNAAVDDEPIALSLITARDIQPFIEPRLALTHKGTFGHVGVIAGSPGRSGAAVLAARGAIRGGAGLVTVMTDAETAKLVHAASIESMTDSSGDVKRFLEGKSAAVIGPGFAAPREMIEAIDMPLVIDASGLDAFAGKPEELNPKGLPRVITPHPGELKRLIGAFSNRIDAARDTAKRSKCVVVLKGHQTLVADPDGEVHVNPTGNPGMATGGMGDVLTGLLGAFLARGVDALDAARAAVYLHGLAGDLLKEKFGDTGLTAMDLADRIPAAIQKARSL